MPTYSIRHVQPVLLRTSERPLAPWLLSKSRQSLLLVRPFFFVGQFVIPAIAAGLALGLRFRDEWFRFDQRAFIVSNLIGMKVVVLIGLLTVYTYLRLALFKNVVPRFPVWTEDVAVCVLLGILCFHAARHLRLLHRNSACFIGLIAVSVYIVLLRGFRYTCDVILGF